jgi:homoaconitase/3-isopropylmalate dehydratase large subunit|tara:strand:- start:7669 stop:8016 length:348 start_codon:yes stop_codon:yes gene_type:complete
MNKCTFLGRLNPDIEIEFTDGKTPHIIFSMDVESFRKSKNGKKKREYNCLEFEAWDTAALTIREKLKSDCTMLVECEARSTFTFCGDSDSELDKTYFRVLSFKIFHANKDWGNEK